MLRLYTFQISHFAEKARWALDWKGVKYQERRLLPGPHLAVTRRLGKVTSVPILVCDGQVVQGSSAIINFADERWPDRPLTSQTAAERDRERELERWLDDELGAPVRRVFYFHALGEPNLVRPLFTQRGPWWGGLFYRVGYRAVASRIRALYKINADTAEQDRKRVEAVFARVDQLLEGRPYLVGDRFGRADLTLAALAAPLWRPPEHSMRWPPDEAYPARLRELRAELGRWRARDHVLRMYREHRAADAPLTKLRPDGVARTSEQRGETTRSSWSSRSRSMRKCPFRSPSARLSGCEDRSWPDHRNGPWGRPGTAVRVRADGPAVGPGFDDGPRRRRCHSSRTPPRGAPPRSRAWAKGSGRGNSTWCRRRSGWRRRRGGHPRSPCRTRSRRQGRQLGQPGAGQEAQPGPRPGAPARSPWKELIPIIGTAMKPSCRLSSCARAGRGRRRDPRCRLGRRCGRGCSRSVPFRGRGSAAARAETIPEGRPECTRPIGTI